MTTITNNRETVDKSCLCTTKLVTSFEQTWTIEDIDRICGTQVTDFPHMFSSLFGDPTKMVVNSQGTPVSFYLIFYPKGCTARYADFVGAFLKVIEDYMSGINYLAQIGISIVDAKGENRLLFDTIKLLEIKKGDACGSDEMIRRAELLDPAKGLLQVGKLVLHCKVGVYECIKQVEEAPPVKLNSVKLYNSVLLDVSMMNLLDHGVHSDVTLLLAQDGEKVEIRAHKAILATRSRFFTDMFEAKMAECTTNRVEIGDIRVDVFKAVLRFIYTGKVDLLDDTIVKELLISADKYQLDSLKSLCDDHLASNLTAQSNLSDLFRLATVCSATKLKDAVVDLKRKAMIRALEDNSTLVAQSLCDGSNKEKQFRIVTTNLYELLI